MNVLVERYMVITLGVSKLVFGGGLLQCCQLVRLGSLIRTGGSGRAFEVHGIYFEWQEGSNRSGLANTKLVKTKPKAT